MSLAVPTKINGSAFLGLFFDRNNAVTMQVGSQDFPMAMSLNFLGMAIVLQSRGDDTTLFLDIEKAGFLDLDSIDQFITQMDAALQADKSTSKKVGLVIGHEVSEESGQYDHVSVGALYVESKQLHLIDGLPSGVKVELENLDKSGFDLHAVSMNDQISTSGCGVFALARLKYLLLYDGIGPLPEDCYKVGQRSELSDGIDAKAPLRFSTGKTIESTRLKHRHAYQVEGKTKNFHGYIYDKGLKYQMQVIAFLLNLANTSRDIGAFQENLVNIVTDLYFKHLYQPSITKEGFKEAFLRAVRLDSIHFTDIAQIKFFLEEQLKQITAAIKHCVPAASDTTITTFAEIMAQEHARDIVTHTLTSAHKVMAMA